MKHALYAMGLFAITVFIIIGVMSVQGRSTREKEQQETLSAALDEAMDNIAVRGAYYHDDPESFKADFVELFAMALNVTGDNRATDVTGSKKNVVHLEDKNLKVQISFADDDFKNGIMGVAVKEVLSYPMGQQTEVSDSAVIILEEEEPKKYCTITYKMTVDNILDNYGYQNVYRDEDGTEFPYDNLTVYKEYTGIENTPLPVPNTMIKEKPDDAAPTIEPVYGWKVLSQKDAGLDETKIYTKDELKAMKITGDVTFVADMYEV